MEELKAVDLSEFNVEIAGKKVEGVLIPSGYIYENWMPLVADHILLGGDQLFNGAVVVLAERTYRDNPERLEPAYRVQNPGWAGPSGYDRAKVAETSRWCVVTGLRQVGEITHFNALYSDGTILPRSYNKSIKWAAMKRVEAKAEESEEVTSILDGILGTLGLGDLFAEFSDKPNSLKGIKYDPHFLDLWLGKGWDSIPENSAAGEADEKPPISPTNFERRLRDADSRSKVRNILKERDDFFGPRLEKKMLEGANPEHLMTIPAGQLILGDVFFLAGASYQVTGLSALEGFEDEIQVDINKIGTTWPKTLSFNLEEKINVAQRS